VITAYVPGAVADNYSFTSALPVQILKNMAPQLAPYVHADGQTRCRPNPPSMALSRELTTKEGTKEVIPAEAGDPENELSRVWIPHIRGNDDPSTV
jgi:hypothetical protein